MLSTRPLYLAEFCGEAVRLVRSTDRQTSEIAMDIGIGYESLHKRFWQHEIDGGNAPGPQSIEAGLLRLLMIAARLPMLACAQLATLCSTIQRLQVARP